MKLIEDYDLEVFTPPCEPGAERFSAIARLTTDISEVLPYLNATLRGAVYNLTAKALTWKNGGRNTAFHSHKIAASNLEDRAEAERVIQGLIKTVNRLPAFVGVCLCRKASRAAGHRHRSTGDWLAV